MHLYKGFELHDKALPLRSVQKSMDSQRIVNGQSSFSHIKLMTTKSQRQRKYGKWPSFQLDRLVTISQIKVFRLSVKVELRLKATPDATRPNAGLPARHEREDSKRSDWPSKSAGAFTLRRFRPSSTGRPRIGRAISSDCRMIQGGHCPECDNCTHRLQSTVL